MSHRTVLIDDVDRVALLREGIVVIHAETVNRTLHVEVAGFPDDRVREAVTRRLGEQTEVEVVGALPRLLLPRRCLGHMEREPGRLQVRYELRSDEHMDQIFVAEDAETAAVLGVVCTAADGRYDACCEVPHSVYLDGPLGDRVVVDGFSGAEVPYKNVYLTLGD
jgi:hypothetical protein